MQQKNRISYYFKTSITNIVLNIPYFNRLNNHQNYLIVIKLNTIAILYFS